MVTYITVYYRHIVEYSDNSFKVCFIVEDTVQDALKAQISLFPQRKSSSYQASGFESCMVSCWKCLVEPLSWHPNGENQSFTLRHTWGICSACTSLALPGASAHPPTTPAAIQVSSTKQKLVRLAEKCEDLIILSFSGFTLLTVDGSLNCKKRSQPSFVTPQSPYLVWKVRWASNYRMHIVVSFVVSLYVVHCVMIRCSSTAFVLYYHSY